jgi:hypothetical protein
MVRPTWARSALALVVTGVLLPSLGACAARSTRNLGAGVAVQGQAVADAALASYRALAAEQEADRRQQEFIRIVTDVNPAPESLPTVTATSFDRELGTRIRAYAALAEVYALFQQLADPAFAERAGTASQALASSLAALQGAGSQATGLSAIVGRLGSLIAAGVQAGKIREHNLVLMELARGYREVWNDDLPAWERYVSQVHDTYARQLASIPLERFDLKAVAGEVREPYPATTRAQLYKVQLRDEARARGAALTAQLRAVGRALAALEQAHTELAKQEPSITDVALLVDDIRALVAPALTMAGRRPPP